jgi:hypothetical protein
MRDAHVRDVAIDHGDGSHTAAGRCFRRLDEREELLDVVAVQRLRAETELEAVVLGRIVRAGDLDAAATPRLNRLQ